MAMNDEHNYNFYVLYHGQAEPVPFDTIEEAITYISAENVGRGLSPVTSAALTNVSLLCFVQDRYCGMILGEQTGDDQQDNRGIGEQRAE